MKICFISDTHGKFIEKIEESDIICHCGDISPELSRDTKFSLSWTKEIFFPWFSSLKSKYKIFIGGNHDLCLEKNKLEILEELKKYPNIIYLEDSYTIIDNIKIYGSPWTPNYYNWAFNSNEKINDENDLVEKYRLIPDDTNVLLTHGPPLGILEQSKRKRRGSIALLDRIKSLKNLKINAFGHNHSGYGKLEINNKIFINCSSTNEEKEVVNNPIYIEI